MKDLEDKSYTKLEWVTLGTARRMLEPYIKDSRIDVWKIDLFSLCRGLSHTFPDTIFFLVEDVNDERLEVL